LPSQKQLKWSQLRVGITVIVASLTLGFLLFLMSGTSGLFTPRITLKSYFDNASGLRDGAPVRLSGVDIGNVTGIRIVPDKDKHLTPVEVTMKLSTKYSYALRRDSMTSLDTAGVLGETYLDIESTQAVGPPAQNGDTLPTEVRRPHSGLRRKRQGIARKTYLRSNSLQPVLLHGCGISADRAAGRKRRGQPGQADQPQRCL
jgi:phospholipid/cholesterol/gamma-HCH transport system substrate-binding protein